MRRVVVTGMGVVSPVGIGVDQYWNALVEGRSGVAPLSRFDSTEHDCKIAAEVKQFEPSDYMERKEARRMDRFAQYAVAGTRMALDQAGLVIDEQNAERVGVLIGSGIGGIETMENQCRTLLERGPQRVSPFLVPMMIPDMASGQVAILFGAKGHNASSVSACASASNSIGDAFRIIQRGDADAMITGGAESGVVKLAMAAFDSAKTLSRRNAEPARASRPFDRDRDGFVLGEGAGILILESLDTALARGAHVLAELVGYGATGDAHHITNPAPGGDGARRAMKLAIQDAGLTPDDVDYVNAHGTSTQVGDTAETEAIKAVFGERAYKLPVSSTKSMTGHLLGAAGGIEAIASVCALRDQTIPPTINYETPDPECDLDYVPNAAREATVDVVVSNSFGFGGHNAVHVFRRFKG